MKKSEEKIRGKDFGMER